ncbi:MAG TPA: tRNA 2-selenouridine(34) synthase MnmH [Planctomycetota bacterium]|nr:tRNA 2-selenouridine(34) synthase MnmH [Planctomycetota bacterium]
MTHTHLRHEVPVVAASELLASADAVVVDLRAPVEFAEDHVPGAVNVPLFDDVGRALIGTLYARVSPEAAFARARELVGGHLGALVDGVCDAAGERVPTDALDTLYAEMTAGGLADLEASLPVAAGDLPARPVVLHCWRGGMRSRSVVALMRALGLERAVGLEGGYKAYRRRVVEELVGWQAPTTYVLRGLTGVGKTLVLRELAALRPGWTLDLEGIAGHRSSILGRVGLEPVTQKTFESGLAARVRAGFPGPVVFEGESRKVGDAIIPETLWRAMGAGTSIELVATTETRVRVLLDDYVADEAHRAQLREALPFLEERLGRRTWAGRLTGLLDAGRDAELALLLLEHYYDPLYRHSEARHDCAVTIASDDPARAAREVAAWIEARG